MRYGTLVWMYRGLGDYVMRPVLFAAILLGTWLERLEPAIAQEEGLRIKSVQTNRGRLVFPVSATVDPRAIGRLLDSLDEVDAVPGFPSGFPLKGRITISLAVSWSNPNVDAWSRPTESLIVLPLSGALTWEDAKLRRIVRHELRASTCVIHSGTSVLVPSGRTTTKLASPPRTWRPHTSSSRPHSGCQG